MRSIFAAVIAFSAASFACASGDASLAEQLAGFSGSTGWIADGGDCRRPALTFSRKGGFGLTIRLSSQSNDGSRGQFSTASVEGKASAFTLRYQVMDGDSIRMTQMTHDGVLQDGRLTLTTAGVKRVYQRCDGDAPARKWEME